MKRIIFAAIFVAMWSPAWPAASTRSVTTELSPDQFFSDGEYGVGVWWRWEDVIEPMTVGGIGDWIILEVDFANDSALILTAAQIGDLQQAAAGVEYGNPITHFNYELEVLTDAGETNATHWSGVSLSEGGLLAAAPAPSPYLITPSSVTVTGLRPSIEIIPHPWTGQPPLVYPVTYTRAIFALQTGASIEIVEPAKLGCQGFDAPLDAGAVAVKRNRVLPHKARLCDQNGQPIDDLRLTAFPVIQVIFGSSINPVAEDVTSEALNHGAGTDGNQFEYVNTQWQLNPSTKSYSAAGTYTVTMESGDTAEYLIEPTCSAQFVVK